MITLIIRKIVNSMPPEERHSFEEQARGILQSKIMPNVIPNLKKHVSDNMSDLPTFFHTSMTCTEIFARNMIHVLHSVISNAICAQFIISIHAWVFVHNHRQYIVYNLNSLRIYVN